MSATMLVSATDSNGAYFSIDDARARVGQEFSVKININNNPGIVSLKLAVNYDAEVLELVNAKAGDFSKGISTAASSSFGPTTKQPFIVNWVDALSTKNIAADGKVATLTFRVKETTASETTISIEYDPNNVFDKDYNNVYFNTVDSTIVIPKNAAGDANGDGKVNGRDYALMLQLINGWDTTLDDVSADVNGDGKLNGRDYALLLQYINGWDVELK